MLVSSSNRIVLLPLSPPPSPSCPRLPHISPLSLDPSCPLSQPQALPCRTVGLPNMHAAITVLPGLSPTFLATHIFQYSICRTIGPNMHAANAVLFSLYPMFPCHSYPQLSLIWFPCHTNIPHVACAGPWADPTCMRPTPWCSPVPPWGHPLPA